MKTFGWVGSLLLVALVGGCAPAAPTSNAPIITFRYSHFDPGVVRVPAGVPIAFTLRNDDPIGHEWIVGTADVHAVHRVGTEAFHDGRANEVSVPPYAARTTAITFNQPGEYPFICHLPGHEAYGMSGVLRVV